MSAVVPPRRTTAHARLCADLLEQLLEQREDLEHLQVNPQEIVVNVTVGRGYNMRDVLSYHRITGEDVILHAALITMLKFRIEKTQTKLRELGCETNEGGDDR